MDTGQSDFTDPPSPRQICFIGSSDVISRIHCMRKGGGWSRTRRGRVKGGEADEDVSYRTRFRLHVDCDMREARSIIEGTEWRSL